MVEAQTISILFAGLSIAASIVYYASVLRNANKTQQIQLETRQAQTFLTLYNRILDENFSQIIHDVQWVWEWSDFKDFNERYGPNSENWPRFSRTMMFLEGIGILVNKEMIRASFIDDFISGMTIRLWEKYGDIIFDLREQYDAPQTYEWVEYLYTQIKPITEEQHKELAT
jgi:hypothetical protein